MGLSLALRDVSVTADNGRVLLQTGDVDIPAGQTVAVRGPSGAGKSTFLNVIAGLTMPRGGAIHWGDTAFHALSGAARTAFRGQYLSMVFQDHLLFEELGAEQNAAIAAGFSPRDQRATIRAAAKQALMTFGVHRDDLPPVARMSGGERQRVAVARALARTPDVLLADEPTANLDRQTADRLIEDLLVHTKRHNMTLIVVSHDANLIMAVDRVLGVDSGVLRDA
ncbi:ABC transporter ATP-binding protein [Monaibacterium marinum]|nr:ATP-binding cassette domain-containing protein [Monaibacterium marinum]